VPQRYGRAVAVRFFLKIGDIKGESKDSKHKDEIEVESYSWGVSQSGTFSPGGGGGAGKAQFSDFSFTMPQSVASPVLFLSCASGKHLKEAVLSARRAGKTGLDFYKLRFFDVLISSFNQGGVESAPAITESITFNFQKVELEYQRQNAKGQLEAPVGATWDVQPGKA
jgi:type VI secretion system secreted protein Hcp